MLGSKGILPTIDAMYYVTEKEKDSDTGAVSGQLRKNF